MVNDPTDGPKMPNVTRTRAIDCQHHHRACYCREARFEALDLENVKLRQRLRETAQVLIEAVGADGTCDEEDAAARAVETVPGHQSACFAGERQEKRGLK